jgi:hypothetical protein
MFIQVDIQDGELMALLEDAPAWGLPPLRPRLSRLLPRTRQSERVRATMMTRQRQQREGDQQRDPAQVCTLFWNRNHLINLHTKTCIMQLTHLKERRNYFS